MHISIFRFTAFGLLVLFSATALGVDYNNVDTYPIEQRPTGVYQLCMGEEGMVSRYDCNCVKEKFRAELAAELKKPESGAGSNPRNTQTQLLVSRVMHSGACRSEKAFARYEYNECKTNFFSMKMILPPNVKEDRFCDCYGKTMGKLFANDPDARNAASSRGLSYYASKAMQKCR